MSEGRIELALRWDGVRLTGLEVRSGRQLGLWKALEGKPVDEALRLAPLLSSICSTAHGVAGVRAVEQALGVAERAQQRLLREVLVTAESFQNHLWFWAMTAPALLGRPPLVSTLRALRVALAQLTTDCGLEGPWVRVGGVGFRATSSLPSVHDTLKPLVDELGLRVPSRLAELSSLPALTGLVFRELTADGLASRGRAPTVGRPDGAWVRSSLATPAFVRTPALVTGPVDVGALAAVVGHPLVREALEVWGPGVGARVVARLVETCATLEALTHQTQELRGDVAAPVELQGEGTGLGEAPTSRGPLFHLVSLARAHVVGWKVVAPTEWTFHPRGAVRDALEGLAAPDVHTARQVASWVVASLDPCVECTVHIGGA